MTAFRVRPLARGDLDACWEIERAVYSDPWRREHLEEMVDLDPGLALAAADSRDRVVGYAMGWVAADEAELANIAVDDDWRRRGVGAGLLLAFAREAGARGAERIWLEVRESNAAARTFYRRYGFTIVGRRPGYYEEPEEDAIVMAAAPADVREGGSGDADVSGRSLPGRG